MTERFPRYIQIYEPFTLKDTSNNSITFEPNGTPLNSISLIDNVRTKVVTLNAYDFESFTDELKSVFDVSFEVKDDLLLTKENIIYTLTTNYGINFSKYDVSNVQIMFNHFHDNSNNSSIVNTNSALHIQSDKSIVFSVNNNDLSINNTDVIIDNSGFIGIGIQTPSCPLHILKSNIHNNNHNNNPLVFKTEKDNFGISIFNNTLNNNNTNTNTYNKIIDSSENSIVFYGNNGVDSSFNSLSICPYSSLANGIKIDNCGNLISYGKFTIANYDSTDGNLWNFNMLNNQANNLQIYNDYFTPFTITTLSGDIGIGTTNPLNRLHIYGDTNNTQLRLGEDKTASKSILFNYIPSTGITDANFTMTHSGDGDSATFSFTQGGNIGMGLKDPSSNLHIYGDNNNTQILLGQTKETNRSSIIEYTQGGLDTSGSLFIGHYDNTDTYKTKGININNNGYVAIGRSDPAEYPLHVNGFVVGAGGLVAFTETDQHIVSKETPPKISILADNGIYGSIVGVTSDIRIKNNIEKLIPSDSLKLLRKLKPVSFNYIDNWNHGPDKMFGFIAQDVQKIIPETSTIISSVIPNIYEYGTIDETHKIIHLKTKITSCFHNKLPVIDVYDKNGNKDTVKCVNIIDETSFEIEKTSIHFKDNDIFIFGEHVSDFHLFKPEIVNTITTSSVQELDDKLATSRKTIKDQENRLHILEELVRNITTRLFKLELEQKQET